MKSYKETLANYVNTINKPLATSSLSSFQNNKTFDNIADLKQFFKSFDDKKELENVYFDVKFTVLDDRNPWKNTENSKVQHHILIDLNIPKEDFTEIEKLFQSLGGMDYYNQVFTLTNWHNSKIPKEQLDLLKKNQRVTIKNLSKGKLFNKEACQASTTTHTIIEKIDD